MEVVYVAMDIADMNFLPFFVTIIQKIQNTRESVQIGGHFELNLYIFFRNGKK